MEGRARGRGMDAETILGLKPRLDRFGAEFGGVFRRKESRRSCAVYVE